MGRLVELVRALFALHPPDRAVDVTPCQCPGRGRRLGKVHPSDLSLSLRVRGGLLAEVGLRWGRAVRRPGRGKRKSKGNSFPKLDPTIGWLYKISHFCGGVRETGAPPPLPPDGSCGQPPTRTPAPTCPSPRPRPGELKAGPPEHPKHIASVTRAERSTPDTAYPGCLSLPSTPNRRG